MHVYVIVINGEAGPTGNGGAPIDEGELTDAPTTSDVSTPDTAAPADSSSSTNDTAAGTSNGSTRGTAGTSTRSGTSTTTGSSSVATGESGTAIFVAVLMMLGCAAAFALSRRKKQNGSDEK